MEWTPALRPEIVQLHDDSGALVALEDGLFGHRINVGPVSRALVPLLDGTRPLGAILETARAALPDRPADAVEHSLRTFLLMNLLDGAGPEIVRRARALRHRREELRPVLLPGARFQCQGSGACCHNYALGPLLQADLERLAALDVERAFPDLGPGPYTEHRTLRDGVSGEFLRTRAGSCIFQQDDGRCGIHAAFGFDQKPRMCRIFPLQDIPTVFGLRIYDRGECTRFGRSARCGTPFAEDLPRILALLGEPAALYHPLVLLDDSTPCDYGHFLRLQDALCALVRARRADPEQTLLAAGRMLRGFVHGLRACPLEPGEPDRTVDAIVGQLDEPFLDPGPSPDPPRPGAPAARREALTTLAAVAGSLLDAVVPTILHTERGPEEHLAVRDLEHFAGIVHSVEALATYREEPQGRVDAFHERVLAVRADDGDSDEAMRLSLQNQLFGLRLLIDDRPVPGMLRVALTYLISVLGAKRLAAREQAPAVREEDLSASHSLALRVLNREGVRQVFRQYESACWDVMAAIPVVLAPA